MRRPAGKTGKYFCAVPRAGAALSRESIARRPGSGSSNRAPSPSGPIPSERLLARLAK